MPQFRRAMQPAAPPPAQHAESAGHTGSRFGEHPPAPSLASTTAAQVHEILRAADRQAEAMRREVEEWASSRVREIEAEALAYLDEAKARSDALVAERLDPVLTLSTFVETRAEGLISMLDRTDWIKSELRDLICDLRRGLQEAESADRRPPASLSSAPPPRVDDEPPAPTFAPPTEHQDDEGLRLLSLQMAMQGSTRAEVEQKISGELGIRHPEAILDEVFGVGTPHSHRIAWNTRR